MATTQETQDFGPDTERTDDGAQDSVARRNLLRLGGIAAAGAAAAAVASAVKADPAGATTGNMQYGAGNNAGTDQTGLRASTSGVAATLQVLDENPTGNVALDVMSNAGTAAIASGNTNNLGSAVYAWNVGSGTALQIGDNGTGTGPALRAQLFNGANASEVAEVSTEGAGKALIATAVSNTGVEARSGTGKALDAATTGAANANPAVQATSGGTGPAVRATGKVVPAAAGVGAGHAAALAVQGRSTFTRSGLLTIPAGASTALTPLVAGGLAATARVLATMQTFVAGNVTVKAAVPIQAGANKGKIQIHLTAVAPAGGVKIAWFVFG